MALDVVRQAATRIAEHAAAHRLSAVHVILHGGEPLLLGERRLREVLAELHRQISPLTTLDLRVHTNAVRLSPALCDLFAEYGVQVGVSLDGDRTANDLHRRFADGRSSHGQVRAALDLLRSPPYQHLYSGILCTIDLHNDPIGVLDALLEERPPRIDFLFPHATWENPPPRPTGRPTAYADWLGRVFDRWIVLGRPLPIRLFDSIESVALGGPSQSEAIGLDPVDLLVIETGGEWEQVDSLKTAYDGAPDTGMNIYEHAADDAAAHPAVLARQSGIAALGETCLACPVLQRCGGGLYAHRYKAGSGFRNPSVYCADLRSLIEHVGVPPRPQTTAREEQTVGLDHSGLDTADLDAIADRTVDQELARRLANSKWTITRVLFAQVGEQVAACGRAYSRCAAGGWDLLCALDQDAPDALRTVLEHPFAREWATRRLSSAAAEPCGQRCAPISAELSGFAIAAAVRAEMDVELELPLRGGVMYLPTLGAWDTGCAGAQSGIVTVRHGSLDARVIGGEERLRIEPLNRFDDFDGSGDANPGWRALRDIGGKDHRVLLEDLDPYRDCHGWPAAGRLSAGAVRDWRNTLASASAALDAWAPLHAEQVRACVRALVPLVTDPSGQERSGTARNAAGAFGVALPERPDALAMLLVHETHHLVLDLVLDAFDLIDPSDTRRINVAWRPDPRPISGALHGVFALLGMAEVWRGRSLIPGEESESAAHTALQIAERTRDTLTRVLDSGALTPLGERFAIGLSTRIRRLKDK